jgi:hypothetical protein
VEILEPSQPDPVVAIMLQCSAKCGNAYLTILIIGNSRIEGPFNAFLP